MKHQFLVTSSSALLIFVLSCAQSGPGLGSGSGGTAVGTGGMSSGGTTGTGGDGLAATGGAPSTGGSNVSTGGSAGRDASGGANASTGGSSTGGSSSGTGGQGGTGGSPGSTGGSLGTAGAAGAGTGGAGGRGGTTGGGLNIADIVPTGFDGFYWEATPSGNTALSGTNYPFGPAAGGCPSGSTWDTTGYINTKTMTVKGTPGAPYTFNINVRGVAGTRCYTGGQPGPGATTNPNASGPNNTWYIGGQQYNASIWNTYELHISGVPAGKPTVYFLNSFPNISNWCQKEATYEIRYNASFQALGGSTLTLNIHDSNCRTLANCGSLENQPTCDSSVARTIDMSGVTPAPTNFSQPRTATLGNNSYYVQWLWIDVTSVTSP